VAADDMASLMAMTPITSFGVLACVSRPVCTNICKPPETNALIRRSLMMWTWTALASRPPASKIGSA
jgi:hypothetical protein